MNDFIFKPSTNPEGDFSGAAEMTSVQQGDDVSLSDGTYAIYVKVDDGFTVARSTPGLVNIFLNYGEATATGVNTPPFATIAPTGQTSEGPFALLNRDGSDPGISLTLEFSAPAPGSNAGFGINTAGNGDGVPGFDGTLYSSVFTVDSYFVGAAYALNHVISGLSPGTGYRVELVASRDASDSRQTRYDFSNGETATIQATADPTSPVTVVETVADGTGTITITQSALSGSWSYLGGLRLTTL